MRILKWLIGIILLGLIILATIAAVLYFIPGPSPKPKGKQALAERFGISLGGTWPELSDKELDETLDDIADIGFTWVRFDISWGRVQPEKDGTFHWEEFDRIVKAANKRKLKILPILTYAPRWAAKPPYQDNYMTPSSNRTKFANFAAAAVKRYAPMEVHAFEIWNEPNLRGFWQPDPNPKEYSDLLKKSYIKIKQADPEAIVVTGGLAPVKNEADRISALDFLEGIYANGGKEYFDAVGYHPTSFPALPGRAFPPTNWTLMESRFFKSIRGIMKKNGDVNKQVWATEFGVPTKGRSDVSESLQAESMEDAARLMKNKPWLKTLFIYSYKDLSNHPVPAENYFGIVRLDGTKKPAYYTLKKLLNNN